MESADTTLEQVAASPPSSSSSSTNWKERILYPTILAGMTEIDILARMTTKRKRLTVKGASDVAPTNAPSGAAPGTASRSFQGTLLTGSPPTQCPFFNPSGEPSSNRLLEGYVSVTDSSGAAISGPRGVLPQPTDGPFTITLNAKMSDSGLTHGPAGRELAQRAIFPRDRTTIHNMPIIEKAQLMVHANLQGLTYSTLVAEEYLETVRKFETLAGQYKECKKNLANSTARNKAAHEEIAKRKVRESEMVKEIAEWKARVTRSDGKVTELEKSLSDAKNQIVKLEEDAGDMLGKGFDGCLIQVLKSNPHTNLSGVELLKIPSSYIDAPYEPFVPPVVPLIVAPNSPFTKDNYSPNMSTDVSERPDHDLEDLGRGDNNQ